MSMLTIHGVLVFAYCCIIIEEANRTVLVLAYTA